MRWPVPFQAGSLRRWKCLRLRWFALFAAVFLLLASVVFAAEVIPPRPQRYVNDYAGVMDPNRARQLNEELAQFERDTSNQMVVAVYPKMQTDSSIEDYTVRIAHAWGVGQKEHKNGAILFVFVQDRKMRIEVGYGLEGALTDMLSHQIIAKEIAPRFKTGDYTGGIIAGVRAMMAAAKGEYKGTGRTAAEAKGEESTGGVGWVFAVIALVFLFAMFRAFRRGVGYTSGPVLYGGGGPTVLGGWGDGGGGSSRGGGGSSGGGFSSGGGDFGGGGASGDW